MQEQDLEMLHTEFEVSNSNSMAVSEIISWNIRSLERLEKLSDMTTD